MKWFRSNSRLGSRLGLLALAIQFLLSFGHFHGGNASSESADAKRPGIAFVFAARLPGASVPVVSLANIPGAVRLKTTSGHEPLGPTGDDCAICAVMALADTMLDAAPPLLLPPHATEFSYGLIAVRFAEPDPVRVAFQPRAPPLA